MILYRSEDSLPKFLDSLQAQSWRKWRLHVVDNASPDGSAALVMARRDPRITVISNTHNLGFAKAANQGFRAAAGAGADLVILINSDTEFGDDFLQRLSEQHEAVGGGVIAPRVMKRTAPQTAWYAGGHFDRNWVFTNNHHSYDPASSTQPTKVDFAPGCCLAIDIEVLRQIGLLDESFFVYWEDTDFCLRLQRAGIAIWYLPEPSILHAGGESSGGEFSTSYIRLYYRSYMQLLRKHFGFFYAVSAMLKLVLREFEGRPGRVGRDRGKTLLMLRFMLLGLVSPLKAEPLL